MSEQGSADHGHGSAPEHGAHAPEAHAAAAHDAHGHDDHGHGHGSGQWIDYNAQPPGRSPLPPVPAYALGVMAVVLALLLGAIVNASLVLAAHESRRAQNEAHAEKAEH